MAVAADLPAAREPPAVPRGEELDAARLSGKPARHPHRQPEPDPRRARPDRAGRCSTRSIAIEDKRFYTNTAIDLRGIGARAVRPTSARRRGAGRLDDHPAVRQGRAGRAGRSARSSRSSARRRSPTTSRASGRRRRSSPSTSTRSISATAPTGSSRPRACTSARPATPTAAAPRGANMCASQLTPPQAALLAGIDRLARRGYDPVEHPVAAKNRRDLVLRDMRDQGYITPSEYDARDRSEPLPTQRRPHAAAGETRRRRTSRAGCASRSSTTSGRSEAFSGGLQITTTLDLDLQQAGRAARSRSCCRPERARRRRSWRSTTGPARCARWSAAPDYATQPVQPRHAGPAPARLDVQAVRARRRRCAGISPGLGVELAQEAVRRRPTAAASEKFVVNNYERRLLGLARRSRARRRLGQLGLRRGRHQGRHAQDRRDRASDGHPHAGLDELRDDARRPQAGRHAARHGARLRDVRHRRQARLRARSARPSEGRSGSRRSRDADGKVAARARPDAQRRRRIPAERRAAATTAILQTVVAYGTGKRRGDPGGFAAGKTGTTENYGDAWFVGFNERLTVAVWVGYPDKLEADADRVRRLAGRRRHLPGADLARLHRQAPIASSSATPAAKAERERQDLRRRRDGLERRRPHGDTRSGSGGGGDDARRHRRRRRGDAGDRRPTTGGGDTGGGGDARRHGRHGVAGAGDAERRHGGAERRWRRAAPRTPAAARGASGGGAPAPPSGWAALSRSRRPRPRDVPAARRRRSATAGRRPS